MAGLHGIAHITGGGIETNLRRILLAGLSALIDLSVIRVLPIFKVIRDVGNVDDREMLRPFDLGVAMTIVAVPGAAEDIKAQGKSVINSFTEDKIVTERYWNEE